MIILKLILPLLLYALVLIQTILTLKWRDRRTKLHKNTLVLLYFLLPFILFLNIAVIYFDHKNTETKYASASKQRDDIQELLKPFTDYAKKMFPQETTEKALENLSAELQQLKNKTTQIEDKISHRSLSSKQMLNIIEKLGQYKNISAQFNWQAFDPEAEYFAKEIKKTLKLGGWSIIEPSYVDAMSLPNGVILYANNLDDEAMISLGLCLKQLGFKTQIDKNEKLPDNRISIQIGKK